MGLKLEIFAVEDVGSEPMFPNILPPAGIVSHIFDEYSVTRWGMTQLFFQMSYNILCTRYTDLSWCTYLKLKKNRSYGLGERDDL